MELRNIVAAMDDSDVGLAAAATAVAVAQRAGAGLTILTVLPPPATEGLPIPEWFRDQVHQIGAGAAVQAAVATGLPGVEIPRYAEEHRADLLVLGRTERSLSERLLVGDTADAVARRSAVPCLFVPQKLAGWSRILASVDGTDRGLSVLVAACDFAQALGGRLRILTVEPIRSDEKVPGTAHLPDARSTRLAQALERLRRVQPDPWENWEKAPGADRSDLLVVRRGNPAAEILAEVSRCAPDVLVFGFRRGGPPGLVEGKSVGRRLAHGAPCATLTIPL